MIDIKKLRELLNDSTPGPWEYDGEYNINCADGHSLVEADQIDLCAYVNFRTSSDAELIAAMRNALPELLDVYSEWLAATQGSELYPDCDCESKCS